MDNSYVEYAGVDNLVDNHPANNVSNLPQETPPDGFPYTPIVNRLKKQVKRK